MRSYRNVFVTIGPLTVAHAIEPWGRRPRALRRYNTSQGVLVRPTRNAHNVSHPRITVCPPTKWVDGWTARTSVPSIYWIVLPSRAQATAAIERDFSAYSLGHKRVRHKQDLRVHDEPQLRSQSFYHRFPPKSGKILKTRWCTHPRALH